MIRHGLLLFLISLISSCASVAKPKVPAAAPRLAVMSYNVNFGIAGDRSVLRVIRTAQVDVIALQESTPAWERAIARAVPRDYAHRFFRHRPAAGGAAILSRHPILRTRVIKPLDQWFEALLAVIRTPQGPLQIMVVHLRPPVSDSGSWVSGYFSTGNYRKREMGHFVRALDPKLPTMIVGDFNENHSGKAVRALKRRGFRCANEIYAGSQNTWRWPTRFLTLRATLDHVLVGPKLVPASARIDQRGNSDHFPLVVEVARADVTRRLLASLPKAAPESGSILSIGNRR